MAGAAAAIAPTRDGRAGVSVNNKVTLAIMGVRGRGKRLTQLFSQMPDVDLAYICDVDQNVLEPALKIAEEGQRKASPRDR